MTAELDALFAALNRLLVKHKVVLTLHEQMELTLIANRIDPMRRPNAPVLRLVRSTAQDFAAAQGLTADGDDPLGCA
jgi:hypothetical protein